MTKYPDYPFAQVAKDADYQIKMGWDVYQKFTCDKCGSRQTMPTPNAFFTLGNCEECGYQTNIEKKGCNFMKIWSSHGLPKNIIR
jgi:hypothetical protein